MDLAMSKWLRWYRSALILPASEVHQFDTTMCTTENTAVHSIHTELPVFNYFFASFIYS